MPSNHSRKRNPGRVPLLVNFLIAVIAIGYVFQLSSALSSRRENPEMAGGSWRLVAAMFVVPMVVSVVVALSDGKQKSIDADRACAALVSECGHSQLLDVEPVRYGWLKLNDANAQDLLTIVQSVLLIFISLEMAHVTLGRLPQKWRELLLIALVLDFGSLFVVYEIKSSELGAFELALLLGSLSIVIKFSDCLYGSWFRRGQAQDS